MGVVAVLLAPVVSHAIRQNMDRKDRTPLSPPSWWPE